MPETVLYDVQDKIAVITLNRPEKMNAINHKMCQELWDVFTDVNNNPDVWVAVITGKGRAFSAGHDLSEPFKRDAGVVTGDDLYLYQLQIYKPFVCAVNGFCLAQGAGLVLCSDVRIASERAEFGWPQVKRGISSVSGPTLLAHRVPLSRAFYLLMTGRFINAQDAERLSLVNEVVPHEQLMDRTMEVAQEIRANAPLAVRAVKEVTMRGLEMGLRERVRFAGLMIERIEGTADGQEGLRAFLEKRQPIWQGR
ncbi:MAG: enoyl-CoA hydratase/isomerase family protein [Chloroflexi bacterium]|nr:enoyl-CoA hydratase/isomerase family protein [Chloroflexota bacterium]MBI4504752.1 enoyl-CoA hydratase/isomerase family protein [Chloroflexota bacterium]